MVSQRNKQIFWLLGSFTGVLVLLGSLLGFLAYLHLERVEAGIMDASLQTTLVDAVTADMNSLRGTRLFQDAEAFESITEPDLDAGAFLNPALPWSYASSSFLDLPTGVRDLVESWGLNWPSRLGTMPIAGLDFAWMSRLRAFRYWSVEQPLPGGNPSPVKGQNSIPDSMVHGDIDAIYEAIPDLGLLSTWVKLRLASALQRPSDSEALWDIFHLTYLAFTSQRLNVMQAALTWHEWVRDAAQDLLVQGRPGEAPPPFLTREDIRVARRALPALTAYLDMAVPPELAVKVLSPGSSQLGVCAALRQRLPVLGWQEAVLGPFYQGSFDKMGPLLRQLISQCRPAAPFRAWTRRLESPPRLLAHGSFFDRWVLQVPMMRRIFGLTLTGMVQSKDLGAYPIRTNSL